MKRPLFDRVLAQLLAFLGCLSVVGIVTRRTWYLERVVGNPRQERVQYFSWLGRITEHTGRDNQAMVTE